MNRRLSGLCLLLALVLAGPVAADEIDMANAAYQRGDYATAEKLLLPLAESGNAYAQYRIGLVYAEATGPMRSTEEAAKWFESAAMQGQPYAQYKLGILYVNGDGVAKDYVQAYVWLSLSARSPAGSASEARRQLDMITPRLSSTQLSDAKQLLRTWRPLKFDSGAPR